MTNAAAVWTSWWSATVLPLPGVSGSTLQTEAAGEGGLGRALLSGPFNLLNDHGACWVLALAFEATPSLLGCMEYSF